MNILILSDQFSYCCGVSKHIYYLVRNIKDKCNLHLLIPGGSAVELLQKESVGYSVLLSLLYRERSIKNFITSLWKLINIIRKNKIDIVHCHNYYLSNIARVASYFTKIKVVQTVHSDFNHTGKLKKYSADHYIFVNKPLYYRAVKNQKNIKNNGRIIFNGIPCNKNGIRKIDPEEKIKILTASRLIPSKGIPTIFQALSLLPANIKKQIIFNIAGTGEMEDELKNLASLLDIKTNFLGEVDNMNDIYSASDIYICSSFSESFGLSLIEAGISNCFVISSDYDGVRFIMRNDIDGFIFNRYSYHDLALKLFMAIDLGDKRELYIKAFKEQISGKFNIEKTALETLSVYSKLIKCQAKVNE